MRLLAILLMLAFAAPMAVPSDVDARRGSILRLFRRSKPVKIYRGSSLLGEMAAGAVGAGAGAMMYDAITDNDGEAQERGFQDNRNECIDCRKPYRERKELEERWRETR